MTTTDPDGTPRPRDAARGWIGWAISGLLLLALAGGAAYWVTRRDAPPTVAAPSFGGAFAMTDQNGNTVTDRSLRGKPYAIFFGFTRCPDVCPTSLNRMAQLRKQLGPDGMKFAIVFVSVDPGHDKRQDIGNYLTLFGTPIIGLTGTDAQLAQIVKAFHVYYEKVPVPGGDYTIDHTAAIYLMDREGRFVTTIDHQEPQDAALAKLKRVIAS
ncbi:SCO family protein [Sphingomonas sp. TDK1]|uniref:SCO family protein n=1 Tax=Sphingomonas sp. TDK1 TaxID=453247 RepID=UPI0007D97590|nr:SCO family protein [Sphingomonas sp. TDK1]OAN63138.1 electron transporter SenC [Sphingomonas sp. TDK1]